MGKQYIGFDEFAEDYREIHTKNVQGISGADSSYFGEFKVRIIWEELYGTGGYKRAEQ